METRDSFWTTFSRTILDKLGEGDDSGLWETALNTILADANLLCQSARTTRPIAAQIGSCSHWMSPHNGGNWFHSHEKFAWPTGYGSSDFNAFGLPEFEWSLFWEWSRENARWERVVRLPGTRMLHLRIALPARTARHERAVAHVLWSPGSPTTPKKKLLQGYAFRKVGAQWQSAARMGDVAPYDFVTLERVRTALGKIPGSMAEDFRRERDERIRIPMRKACPLAGVQL